MKPAGPASREETYRAVEARTFARVFGAYLDVRMAVAPVILLAVLGVALVDPAPWRRLVAVVVTAAALYLFWRERQHARRRGVETGRLPINMALMAVLQVVVVALTGFLESPVLPVIYLFAAVAGVVLGRGRALAAIVVLQVAALFGFAGVAAAELVPDGNLAVFGGGPRAGHPDALLWASAAFGAGVVVTAAALGSALRGVFRGMVFSALDARQATLDEHVARGRELLALSAEIAHELKNPLASVHGLAALVARELPGEGRAAERMAVLRSEVERMRGILDEFLAFGRPLVPLHVEPCDLGAAARDVAALHEAAARQAGVGLAVAGPGATVRCDPRKVRQVLVNLVQNAIDASPPGGTVRVVVEPVADGARVTVRDEGAGPPAELGDRVFEAGVTGKAAGSGLGLTIARAIARQHGGEVDLAARAGGCEAVLRLPAEPREEGG